MLASEMVKTLSMPLPEDILKHKWAGNFELALRAIQSRLDDPAAPELLKARLAVEAERIRRLPTQYPFDRAGALEAMQKLVPDFTEEELDAYEARGMVDMIYVKGEKRYFVRWHRTLVKYPELAARAGHAVTADSAWLDPMIAEIREKGVLSRRICMKAGVSVDDDAFVPGDYRAWLPLPARSAQQSDIVIDAPEAAFISPEDAPARTAYFERHMDTNAPFTAKYAYTATIRYADPLNAPAPAAPLYHDALPVCEEDLSEQEPYIHFTPYLRALAAQLTENAADDAHKARAIYDYVTTKVNYAFMRDYFQIDNLAEYCAINQRGDCGLQALAFITLCRIVGIPARWQSGMAVEEDGGGSHDWAQFYLPGWGWLFCDPSYGGSAWRCGSTVRHDFYFGNLEPCRFVANRVFGADFTPAADFLRWDPWDNQCGEIQRVGAELPFTCRQLSDFADLAEE